MGSHSLLARINRGELDNLLPIAARFGHATTTREMRGIP
jgi:hypothetical protein